jgi:hypothetical protein
MVDPVMGQPLTSGPSTPDPQTESSTQRDDERIRRLLRGESTGLDPAESLKAAMSDAADRLGEHLNPGPQTQEAQVRALAAMDELIAQARENRAQKSGKGNRRQEGSRQAPSRRDRRDRQSAKSQEVDGGRGGGPKDGDQYSSKRDKRDARAKLSRGWGYLPQRQREEIMQGYDEAFPARYRRQIADYYRRLAEPAETSGDRPRE